MEIVCAEEAGSWWRWRNLGLDTKGLDENYKYKFPPFSAAILPFGIDNMDFSKWPKVFVDRSSALEVCRKRLVMRDLLVNISVKLEKCPN